MHVAPFLEVWRIEAMLVLVLEHHCLMVVLEEYNNDCCLISPTEAQLALLAFK